MGRGHRDAPGGLSTEGVVPLRRTLLVSNDFPPQVGGIQSYLDELTRRLPAERLVVYAPVRPGAAQLDATLPFPVVRHPGPLMLPVPSVATRAARVAREHRCEAVWFGAAAPLGMLGGVLRHAGIERVVACTHGHEVGWAMAPGGRAALGRIGRTSDVVTVVSHYTRRRIASAFGAHAALEHLPPGVDTTRFRPDPAARDAMRRRYRLGAAPVIVCIARLVPRKGQDVLIRALPEIRRRVPGAVLLLVGAGRSRPALHRLAAHCEVETAVVWASAAPMAEVPAHHAAGDVFAMPCRTRGGGLDVEGLGMVFLEAAATGLPVVAGSSGGAAETVRHGETGYVVDGRDVMSVATRVANLLADPELAARLGAAGREWMHTEWSWDQRAGLLASWLGGV